MALGIKLGIIASTFPQTPSFNNTYSLAFDGVDDFVNSGASTLSGETALSISAWVYPTSYGDATAPSFVSTDAASPRAFYLGLFNGTNFRFSLSTNGTALTSLDTAAGTVDLNVWQHILVTWDQVNLKLYKNGVLLKTVATTFASNGTFTTANDLLIGARRSSAGFFEGNIDEVAVFNSVVDIADVWDGTGEATDLSSISGLTNWYRNGDNGTFKSPQWLIPENSNKTKFSNYSFEFDGVDDLFSYPEITFLKGGGSYFSISMWVKVNTSTQRGFWCCRSATPDNIDFWMNASGKLILSIKSSVSGNIAATSTSALSNDTWTHIGATFDGTEAEADRIKLYVNGSPFASSSTGTGTNLPNGALTNVNYIGSTWQGIKMLGNIDETAIWNTTLSGANMTSIYNSGTPTTLPSGAVAYWKMGEDATFSTNWTVPDGVGSFDATSANMTIEDRVGDAPNSTSNALSYNMDEADRETDVPS